MDFVNTWHPCAKNGFLLTALLSEPLAISFTRVNSILKQKNGKNGQKRWSYAIGMFIILVVSIAIIPLIGTVG